MRWRVPLQVVITQWQLFGEASSSPIFRLDLSSWPYVISLSLLALAFILTDAARLEKEALPYNWALGLALVGLGLLAVMAGNPITLVLTWTAVDLVEFLMVISTAAGRRLGVQTVTLFSVRVAGTLLVILAILFARSQNTPFELAPIPESLALFMLLAAGLRLGVLPLNLPYTGEVYAWRGLGNVMRMIGPASSLMVLGRMPVKVVPENWQGLLIGLSALAAVYGGMMWLAADNELEGRPFWSIALAALAVVSVINGNPQASILWGTALILSGSVLFFYSAQRQQILILPLFGILGFVGLPFTPAAAGWVGVIYASSGLVDVLFFLAVICLILGYLRHIFRPREELYPMERWVHTVFPGGLLFLIAGEWLIGGIGWPGSLTLGVIWPSLVVVSIAGIGVGLAISLRRSLSKDAIAERWLGVFSRQVGGVLSAIFRLNWLYQVIAWFYRLLQSTVQMLTAVLEGDGGILWSLVMLALLISLILAGVSK